MLISYSNFVHFQIITLNSCASIDGQPGSSSGSPCFDSLPWLIASFYPLHSGETSPATLAQLGGGQLRVVRPHLAPEPRLRAERRRSVVGARWTGRT